MIEFTRKMTIITKVPGIRIYLRPIISGKVFWACTLPKGPYMIEENLPDLVDEVFKYLQDVNELPKD